MTGYTILIPKLLEPCARFIIPLYQRNYDWRIEHCQQLLDDIKRIHKDNVDIHFFGSIVTRQESLSSDNILIIDGQQRITTITLLMAALINASKEGNLICNDISKRDRLWKKYICDEFLSGCRHYKLQPIEKDRIALDAILDGKTPIANSNITINYRLFYDWVANCGLTLDDIYDALCKLMVIDIRLDEKDDPQLIFESINSTGLELSEADKIRNYFLMSLSASEQEKYYKEYWNPIEECTNYKPTMFIRGYLSLQQKKFINREKLYSDFKQYIKQHGDNRLEVLEDMLPYAKEYHKVITASAGDKAVNRKLKELRTIDSTVDTPFYVAFLRYADEQGLSNEYIYKVLDVIENYWARRMMCNYPANAIAKVFCTLHSDILNTIRRQSSLTDTPPADYLEVLKYILLNKQGKSAFPRDTEVRVEFKTRQVYRMPVEYRYFLFERMENQCGKEVMDIVRSMKDNDITIEHIMPQTLTPQWISDLGDNAQEIHEKYLHTFGNLTLTGFNSEYSNRSFAEKKAGYVDHKGKEVKGFNESAFRMSVGLKDVSCWNETAIIERNEKLCNQFLQLWPEITTTFIEQHRTDILDFDPDDKYIYTGRGIIAYTYKGIHCEVYAWKIMLIMACESVYKEYPFEVQQLCKSGGKDLVYSTEKLSATSYSAIGDNCYVRYANSTSNKINILQNLFDTCGIDYSDLSFEVQPQSSTNTQDE